MYIFIYVCMYIYIWVGLKIGYLQFSWFITSFPLKLAGQFWVISSPIRVTQGRPHQNHGGVV